MPAPPPKTTPKRPPGAPPGGGARGVSQSKQGVVNARNMNGTNPNPSGYYPLGTAFNSIAPTNTPPIGLYGYNSNYGNAQDTEAAYAGMQQTALGQRAPGVSDPYGALDQRNAAAVLGGYGGLTGYYQNELAGNGPSLAQLQLQQGTQQALQAQMAAANSARGPLAGALAQRNAALAGQQTMVGEAGQAAQLRLQEQTAAAQGLAGALQGQGQFSLGEQGLNQGLGIEQARVQEQQNALNAQTGLGYAGLGAQTAQAQLGAYGNYGSAYLAAQGQGVQQSEFNSAQQSNLTNQVIGGGAAAAGAGIATAGSGGGGGGGPTASDVKLREPGGGSGFTIREEPDFLLVRNDRTGEMRKLATAPLSPDEHRQAMAPHGAGPLGADRLLGGTPLPVKDPRTGYLYASDLSVGDEDSESPGLFDAMQQAAGPANANGTYTPDAGTPTGIGGVMQGSDLSSSQGSRRSASSMIGQDMQSYGRQLSQSGTSNAVGPSNIPGLDPKADPNSYGVRSGGSDASGQLIGTVAKAALVAALL